MVVWESNVIVRYLSAKFGPGTLWPSDPGTRAVADEWMDWQQTTLFPDMRTVFWGAGPASRAGARAGGGRCGRGQPEDHKGKRLDHHLRDRRFVAGDTLTMGDIPVGAMCYRYHALGVDRAPAPEPPGLGPVVGSHGPPSAST